MYNLSFSQREMYSIETFFENSSVNNISLLLAFKKKHEYKVLNDLLNKLIEENDSFRIKISIVNGEAKQDAYEFEYTDFPLVVCEDEEELMQKAKANCNKPLFAYDKYLYNIVVFYNKAADIYWPQLTLNHIITDGWSMGLVMNFFSDNLRDCYVPLEKADSFLEIIDEEEKYLESKQYAKDKEYWDSKISSYSGSPLFIYKSDVGIAAQGKSITYLFSKEINEGIDNFCLNNNIGKPSFFNIVAALYKSIITRNKSVSVGVLIHNRRKKSYKNTTGTFARFVPLILEIDNDMTISDFLKYDKAEEYELLKHSKFDIVNSDYKFEKSLSDLLVSYQMLNLPVELFDVLDPVWVQSRANANSFQLIMSDYNVDHELEMRYEFSTSLFSDHGIELMHRRITCIIESIINNPDIKIGDIKLCTDEEKELITNKFNGTAKDYPKDKTIVELFEEQVKKTPDNSAVVFEDKSLTFAEFNAKANSLAHKLRELGVKPDDFVAIIAERSIEMMCGIYGIIKSGGAYVPIDPNYPDDRITFMLGDCKPKAILRYTSVNIPLDTEIPIIDLADDKVWEGASENPEHVNKPEDLIYCIYTSGTTGKPKGVPNRHRGLINRINWMDGKYPIGKGDTVLQKTTFTFDVSVWEIIWWSLKGARCALLSPGGEREPEMICDAIQKYNVTTMHFVPSMLSMFEEYIENLKDLNKKISSLRNVFASGEALKTIHVQRFYSIAKANGLKMKLANFYGPTEASIDVTYYDCQESDVNLVPIGKPIDNTQIYVVSNGKFCGIGVPGELCIAGDGLAREYLNRPELTAEKFVKNPFGEGRMYRSGDLARWLPDGNIEYLGRIDEQVKIRGFRIELGEIESHIRKIDGIKDCAVIVREDDNGDKAIYAYFTSDSDISIHSIKSALSANLPDYMVPAYIMRIDSIPVTPNGKLDRKGLPVIKAKASNEYVAPRNDAESAVCKAFGDILNIEKIGIHDSFFDLGGDSIKAVRIISRLRDYGYEVNVKDVMVGRTAEQLAVLINPISSEAEYAQGEVSGKAETTPIINTFINRHMPHQEHFNQALMINVNGIDNAVLKKAMEEIVKHHDVLRSVFRNGELEILSINDSKLPDYYEFDLSGSENADEFVERKCTEIQSGIDLANGPLVKAAVFSLKNEKIMMICIHHLVVDGLSWRIILEDLRTAADQLIKGENVVLPKKTASFIEWSQMLRKYAEDHAEENNRYWQSVSDEIRENMIVGDYTDGKTGYSTFTLDGETAKIIKNNSENICGASTEEVLIAGLTMAMKKLTGQDKLSLRIEGHGREEIIQDISIDRTVGWFTNIYSITLEYSDDIEKTIISVKDKNRMLPDKRMGYGFAEHDSEPELCFNYLGEYSENAFELSEYSNGLCANEANVFNELEVNCFGRCSKMIFTIKSGNKRFGQVFTDKLADLYGKSLSELAEYCSMNNNSEVKTLSDMQIKEINEDELDFINSLLD
ncbi:non-ribosomal peptide synthetase [Ruminococcus flavefaciens]|uniref:non-ribosomal peptide synthetase n=1 Tax=Ruminococcus flavefaciens TaxID=1265 RepID=UPI0004AF249D|nr:non-ribosomal peptide synthetase [Ruminococcus flavefaciens]